MMCQVLCLEHVSSAPMWPKNQLVLVKINYNYYFLFNRALNQLLKYYENCSQIETSFSYNLKKKKKRSTSIQQPRKYFPLDLMDKKKCC